MAQSDAPLRSVVARERFPRESLDALWLVLFSVVWLTVIIEVWPEDQMARAASLLASLLTDEARYLLMVAAGAATGTTIVRLAAFLDPDRRVQPSPWRSLLHELIAAVVGSVFYMIFRGALLRPERNVIACLNPYGVLAASIAVGLFAVPLFARFGTITRALSGQESELNDQLGRVATALGVATLTNYNGYLCVSTRDPATGSPVKARENILGLKPRAVYDLVVWFQSHRPEEDLSAAIRVTGGNDAKIVEFDVTPDSEAVTVRPRQETISFPHNADSPLGTFSFQSPESSGAFEIWIEVIQKNRLIHVMATKFEVKA